MIYGYIRVSTASQDRENQRHGILEYANRLGLTPVTFIEETITSRAKLKDRKIWNLINEMQPGDILITSEISRIGRSVSEIMQIFQILVEKNITTHIIKGGYTIGGGENKIQSTVLIFAFGLAAEIERELISQRTKEALAKKKKEGIRLGRPPGKAKKVMLDDHKDKIIFYLEKGMSKSDIAKIFDCTRNTVIAFLKRHNLTQYLKQRKNNAPKVQRNDRYNPGQTHL